MGILMLTVSHPFCERIFTTFTFSNLDELKHVFMSYAWHETMDSIILRHSFCLMVHALHPGFKYPVYAVQWHPEKAPFEWKNLGGISHAPNAVKTSFYLAEFLVSEGNIWAYN